MNTGKEVKHMEQSWIQELNSKYRKIRRAGGMYSAEDLSAANDVILEAIAKIDVILKKREKKV
jgi:predicted DNA-binding protein (UPF0278 family)